MAIVNNRLTTEQYEKNFSDIHPPFENKSAALVEANQTADGSIRIPERLQPHFGAAEIP